MKQPHEYPKRIFLAVSGMSPQIVTETVYALTVNHAEPFVPTEIHLITTQSGARQAKLQLLAEGSGQFWQLCAHYNLSDIRFSEQNIHVIEDRQGLVLDDIKTPEQNEAAADFITAIVSELSRDDDTAIHVSIAGGRKTMGYYLGYALSLYGRSQDRLSHVLVTDRYENLKDFFYPTPDSRVVYDRDNLALDAKDAEVMLAEIPFVRLREGIPERLLEGRSSFNESVKFVRLMEEEPNLRIDLEDGTIWVKDIQINLTQTNLVFYLWTMEHSMKGEFIKRSGNRENNKKYSNEIDNIYEKYLGKHKLNNKLGLTLALGVTGIWLNDRINEVNKAFNIALGKHTAKRYCVQKIKEYRNTRYFIDLTNDQVQFEGN